MRNRDFVAPLAYLNHAAALVQGHPARRALSAKKAALQIGLDGAIPIFFGKFEQRSPGLYAGIVNQDVEVRHVTQHAVDLVGHPDVRLHGKGVPAELADLRRGVFRAFSIAVVVDGNIAALAGEFNGDAAPDAFARSGNERFLAGEVVGRRGHVPNRSVT